MLIHKKPGAIIFGAVLLLALAACLPTPAATNSTPTPSNTPFSLPPTWTELPPSNTPELAPFPTLTATSHLAALTPQPDASSAAESGSYLPFEHINMVSPQEGWSWGFIKDLGMRFWRTSDGGQTWIDVTPISRAWDFEFALDALTAWALVCQSSSDYCEETLAMTEDGGSSWSVFPEPVRASLPVFRFQSKTSGLLTEYDVGAGSGFWIFSETSDGGQTWDRVEIISDPLGDSTVFGGKLQTCNMCGDLLYLDQNLLLKLDGSLNVTPKENIPIWASYNQGASWQAIELDFPTERYKPAVYHAFRPVFFEDGFGILPYELAGMYDESSTMVFYTTSDGLNWKLQSFVENAGDVDSWNEMDILSSEEIFFACGSELCVSLDGAQTWNRISSNLNFNKMGFYPRVLDFDFVDGQNGWALVEPVYDFFTLWRTTDGGRNWSELEPSFVFQ